MKCSSCGAEINENDKFCFECGTPVVKKLFCRNCGEELRTGAKFCSICGTPVKALDEPLQKEENEYGIDMKSTSASEKGIMSQNSMPDANLSTSSLVAKVSLENLYDSNMRYGIESHSLVEDGFHVYHDNVIEYDGYIYYVSRNNFEENEEFFGIYRQDIELKRHSELIHPFARPENSDDIEDYIRSWSSEGSVGYKSTILYKNFAILQGRIYFKELGVLRSVDLDGRDLRDEATYYGGDYVEKNQGIDGMGFYPLYPYRGDLLSGKYDGADYSLWQNGSDKLEAVNEKYDRTILAVSDKGIFSVPGTYSFPLEPDIDDDAVYFGETFEKSETSIILKEVEGFSKEAVVYIDPDDKTIWAAQIRKYDGSFEFVGSSYDEFDAGKQRNQRYGINLGWDRLVGLDINDGKIKKTVEVPGFFNEHGHVACTSDSLYSFDGKKLLFMFSSFNEYEASVCEKGYDSIYNGLIVSFDLDGNEKIIYRSNGEINGLKAILGGRILSSTEHVVFVSMGETDGSSKLTLNDFILSEKPYALYALSLDHPETMPRKIG